MVYLVTIVVDMFLDVVAFLVAIIIDVVIVMIYTSVAAVSSRISPPI